jgi:very-short-patch-repair endonuclease
MNIKQSLCGKRRLALAKKATESELAFKARLEEKKIKFVFQKGFIAGNGFYIVGFYIPKPFKIAIEIDGKYHESERQREYDKRKDEYLTMRGFRVVRVKNEDVQRVCVEKILSHPKNNQVPEKKTVQIPAPSPLYR